MKYKLYAFFAGRNGFDALGKTLLWTSLIVMILSSFIGIAWLHLLLYWGSMAAFIYTYFRAFSRKLDKRQAENAKFVGWWHFHKQRFQQRKTHKLYRCPACRQQLRVPKGKGKVSITCRGCGEKFIRKT